MKEKMTEKKTVYGLAEGHWMSEGHSYGTLSERLEAWVLS